MAQRAVRAMKTMLALVRFPTFFLLYWHVNNFGHLYFTGMNPMLLNAQLQQLQALNPLLYGSQFNPGLLQAQATAERLRAMATANAVATSTASNSSNRYSPYPLPSPPKTSISLSSPTSSSTTGSAFSAVKKAVEKPPMPKTNESSSPKPEAEKPMETDQKPSIKPETTADETTAAAPSSGDSAKDISDIQNMEKLVNGLNGSSASKFGISHNNNDQQISA